MDLDYRNHRSRSDTLFCIFLIFLHLKLAEKI